MNKECRLTKGNAGRSKGLTIDEQGVPIEEGKRKGLTIVFTSTINNPR
jgi:hypothetical protein